MLILEKADSYELIFIYSVLTFISTDIYGYEKKMQLPLFY